MYNEIVFRRPFGWRDYENHLILSSDDVVLSHNPHVWCSTQCVRGLDILKIQFFVLHNSDTISFPLFNFHFLRYNSGSETVTPYVLEPERLRSSAGHSLSGGRGWTSNTPGHDKLLSCPCFFQLFWGDRGSVPKKQVGVDRSVMNINFFDNIDKSKF